MLKLGKKWTNHSLFSGYKEMRDIKDWTSVANSVQENQGENSQSESHDDTTIIARSILMSG